MDVGDRIAAVQTLSQDVEQANYFERADDEDVIVPLGELRAVFAHIAALEQRLAQLEEDRAAVDDAG